PMKLSDLLRDVPVRGWSGVNVDVAAVTADSRLVKPGSLFVAIAGFQTDGARFIDAARQKGAVAVVSEGDTDVQVDDARAALATIAANFYGRPADALSLVGVTGTSGKTTTTKMVESIF